MEEKNENKEDKLQQACNKLVQENIRLRIEKARQEGRDEYLWYKTITIIVVVNIITHYFWKLVSYLI